MIIGVIAALTIPTAISKYRKQEVASRLKSTYSIIANMLKMAEAHYGTIDSWDLNENSSIASSNANAVVDAFVQKYMLPYISVQEYGRKTYSQFGYPNGILVPGDDTRKWANASSSLYGITLSNGVFFRTALSGTVSGDKANLFAVVFTVDINGRKGPNTMGKDTFQIMRYFDSSVPLVMCGLYGATSSSTKNIVYNETTGVYDIIRQSTREELLSECAEGKADVASCGALIQLDGWKVSDDYPWL